MLIFNEEIKGIADDSRNVKNGFLFIAIKGLTVDGHKYISQAIKNGAKVIVGEEDLKLEGVKYVKVKNSREELGILASKWYRNPSSKLKIIGVTGTDGKTTTSNLIYWILKTAGHKVGLISTINAKIGDKEYDTGFHVTNPEPLLLQKLLSEMVKSECEYAILEVTSHGLHQDRVAGVKFDIGVLTNITHEHLDYHKTIENYIAAKGKLFKYVKYAFVNGRDNNSSKIIPLINKEARVVKYNFELLNDKVRKAIKSHFLQNYNWENATAAVNIAEILKIKPEDIIRGIESFPELSGRMEEIKNKKGIKIYVDFAHTPNALEKVLSTLSETKKGKLICVFGCAGERDVKKRTLMPQVSVKLADFSIFTAEDPRKENIEDILKVMKEAVIKNGGVENKNFILIPERGKAIFDAINHFAREKDTVVICGKGHERSMSYNGIEYPWSDQAAVRIALGGK